MSLTKKQQAVRDAEKALRDAQAELALSLRTRQAEPGPDSKVRITAVFPRSTKVYEYLALRADGVQRADGANWYITGQEGRVTWDQIIDRVERADYQVQHLFFR